MATLFSRRFPSRFAMLPALAVLIAVGFAAGLGFTAVRASGHDTVEACVNRYTGAVRMNQGSTSLNCTSSEFKRTWDGSAAAGLNNRRVATAEQTFDNATGFGLAAECLVGEQAVGGGAGVFPNTYQLVSSRPDVDNDRRWVASAVTTGQAEPATLTVYAICASTGS